MKKMEYYIISIITIKILQKYNHSNSIVDYDEETILLFSASLDSTIQIYDERDYDNSVKLRMYKGGHTINKRKCEILY